MPNSRLIVFCANGNPQSGLGHLVRSVALAEAFVARGHRCAFAGAAPEFLQGHIPGGPARPVPEGLAAWRDPAFTDLVGGADLLVTDHYGLDAPWQRQSPVPVLAISDPPLRPQHCSILLLPTAFESPDHPEALLAPQHCLLRSQIVARRRAPKQGTKLLINCGGGDDRGLTMRVLAALAADAALAALPMTIVPGQGVRNAALDGMTARLPAARMVENVVDMAALIDAHDIAIGAPGGGALERACLGLAQILIPIADNQEALGNGLAARSAAAVLPAGADAAAIASALRKLVDDVYLRRTMAAAAFTLIDGQGSARVVRAVEERIFKA